MKQLAISFDTTGSMYPALAEVRRRVSQVVEELLSEIPDLEIAIIAHGDYHDVYEVTSRDFSSDAAELSRFIGGVRKTHGFGNGGECYERMFSDAWGLSWSDDAQKALLFIGDEPAHGWYSEKQSYMLDWRIQIQSLLDSGIAVYPVQALRSRNGKRFNASAWYEAVSEATEAPLLQLDQLREAVELIQAVAFHQAGQILVFEEFLRDRGKVVTRTMERFIDPLAGLTTRRARAEREDGLVPVDSSRFQYFDVSRPTPIRDFVEAMGIEFKPGRGFYQLAKRETVQPYKEVVLRERATGEFFEGAAARAILGLGDDTAKIRPSDLPSGYDAFIQSTSYNRKLHDGFLYEVADDTDF